MSRSIHSTKPQLLHEECFDYADEETRKLTLKKLSDQLAAKLDAQAVPAQDR